MAREIMTTKDGVYQGIFENHLVGQLITTISPCAASQEAFTVCEVVVKGPDDYDVLPLAVNAPSDYAESVVLAREAAGVPTQRFSEPVAFC